VTPWGKFIGSIVVILGIGLFALPTGVLASGFAEVLAKRKEAQEKARMICPHCGRHIGDTAGRSGIDDLEEMRAK
jgi:voltage-gated potassium channel